MISYLDGDSGNAVADVTNTNTAHNHHSSQQHQQLLVHHIASFLSLSEAAAATTTTTATPADSWAVGVELETDHNDWSMSTVPTPLTPALVTLSPQEYGFDHHHHHDTMMRMDGNNTQTYHRDDGISNNEDDPDYDTDEENYEPLCREHFLTGKDNDDDEEAEERMQEVLQERRRKWAQEKITSAVFSHPRPLRSYCWEAFTAANDIRTAQRQEIHATTASVTDDGFPPETHIENPGGPTRPTSKRKRRRQVDWGRLLLGLIFGNVPVSVLIDLLEAGGSTAIDAGGATFYITVCSIQQTASTLGFVACVVFDTTTHIVTNPFQLLEAVISLQFNAMGKTGEVIASGIQSVATGVGSASSSALYRLSATVNMSSSASMGGHHVNRKSSGSLPGEIKKNGVLNKRLLKKLATINDAALVVDYQEREDNACGLTRHAVSRTRRMMHYSVSLRPFVATISLKSSPSPPLQPSNGSIDTHNGIVTDHQPNNPLQQRGDAMHRQESSSHSSGGGGEDESPFMCTPQSFPPTPHSRQAVIDQRSQLSDDVIFLARDRLRVHDGLASNDEITRERSQALEAEKRLAIFAAEASSGIELTCGRHIATKVGSMYYASVRSMVPVLRNCYVYSEFTVLPRPGIPLNSAVASLSIGVSTQEMPPNTLVGAWQGSVGLCTTGQILIAGQWCSPADPATCAFGVGATVGCLVSLDDESAFETWEGRMVKSAITFNVNGSVVSPPVPSSLPTTGAPSIVHHRPPSDGTNAFGHSPSDRISPVTQHAELTASSSKRSSSSSPPATLTLLVPAAEDVYPTVTLQSSATSVVSRFSSEDVVSRTRKQIGAPPRVAVYAIDGSVMFTETTGEEEEDETTSSDSETIY